MCTFSYVCFIVIVVQLHYTYIQGSWRKVTVDDHLPFLIREASSEEVTGSAIKYQPLYPRTAIPGEIWPALLMKALLKVAALE